MSANMWFLTWRVILELSGRTRCVRLNTSMPFLVPFEFTASAPVTLLQLIFSIDSSRSTLREGRFDSCYQGPRLTFLNQGINSGLGRGSCKPFRLPDCE